MDLGLPVGEHRLEVLAPRLVDGVEDLVAGLGGRERHARLAQLDAADVDEPALDQVAHLGPQALPVVADAFGEHGHRRPAPRRGAGTAATAAAP